MTVLLSDLKKKNLNCLLIEDNPGDIDLLKKCLDQAPGLKATLQVCNRLGEVGSIDKDAVDVVLLDLNLPDSFGIETLGTAKILLPGKALILLTGLEEKGLFSGAFKEGAQDYLIKGSFTPRGLSRAILHAVERNAQAGPLFEEPVSSGKRGAFTGETRAKPIMSKQIQIILVVEDEVDLRALNCEFLKTKGYGILQAADSDEAMRVWERHKDSVDLLLTDYLLPGTWTGKQLAELLVAENPGLKVLLTSGTPSGMQSLPSENVIVGRFLQKPYSIHDLAKMVEECLREKL